MTAHGIVDITLRETTNAMKYQEIYVSLTRFLTSSYAALIGIQRIAYSTGSAPVNRGGSEYWDEGRPTSPNAWSAYKFLSASVPFYMLLQYSTNLSFGTTPGNPGGIDGVTSANGVGIAFAMREDSGNAWAGTSNNNGADTKGATVWTAGTSSLYVWPRSNSTGGTNAATKEMMMGIPLTRQVATTSPSMNSRVHFVCDENNVVAVADDGGDQQYRALFFGKYTPRANITASCPYVALRSSAFNNNPALTFTTYGSTTSGIATTDGGIAHPRVAASGTRQVQISALNEFFSVLYQPAGFLAHQYFDEFPIHVAVSESPLFGYAGYTEFIKFAHGTPSPGTNQDFTRAYFGANGNSTTKVSIPWNGTTSPGVGVSRTGSMF